MRASAEWRWPGRPGRRTYSGPRRPRRGRPPSAARWAGALTRASSSHFAFPPADRRLIVLGAELSACEIASHFEVTRSAISQHLTVLKDARLLTERRIGTRRLYRARPEGLAEHAGCTKQETLELLRTNGATAAEWIRQLDDAQRDHAAPMALAGGALISVQQLVETVVIDSTSQHLASIRAAD